MLQEIINSAQLGDICFRNKSIQHSSGTLGGIFNTVRCDDESLYICLLGFIAKGGKRANETHIGKQNEQFDKYENDKTKETLEHMKQIHSSSGERSVRIMTGYKLPWHTGPRVGEILFPDSRKLKYQKPVC